MAQSTGVSPVARFVLIFVFVCGTVGLLVGVAEKSVPSLPWVVQMAGALCALVAGVASGFVDLLAKLKRSEDKSAAFAESQSWSGAPRTGTPRAAHHVPMGNRPTRLAQPGPRTDWIIATAVTAVFSLFFWPLVPIPIITGLVAARRTKAAWLVAVITVLTVGGGTLLLLVLATWSSSMSY